MPRPRLVLLHGALGAADQMAPLAERLAERLDPVVPDLPGHGVAPLEGAFDTDHFAAWLITWLDQRQEGPVDCFGYSMGGYVALEAARRRPDLFRSLTTLGTKFAWTPEVAAREGRLLDPRAIRAKVPWFADQLERRHTALGWEEVLRLTGGLMDGLGETPVHTDASLSQVQPRVRIMVGDRDRTVTVEESQRAARALPRGELEVLPATPHPFDRVPLGRIAWSLGAFYLGVDE